MSTLTGEVVAQLADSGLKGQINVLVEGLRSDLKREPSIEDMLTRLRTLIDLTVGRDILGLAHVDVVALETSIMDKIAGLVKVDLPERMTAYDNFAQWIGAIERDVPLTIFTTNYDLLTEQSMERHAIPFFDGFVGSENPFFDLRSMEQDAIPNRWLRLWKLHGSINWKLLPDTRVVRGIPKNAAERRLIHPSHLKYDQSRRMPYLAMQDQFRKFLGLAGATLITIGYSFGDEHINDVIVQGLQANPRATAFGLLFGEIENYPNALREAEKYKNLGLFARDKGCIAGVTSPWCDTEQEDPKRAHCSIGDFGVFASYLSAATTNIFTSIS